MRIKTTEEAVIKFLEQNGETRYSFAVELCEEIGYESFARLMKKFSGLQVKFPDYEKFEQFMKNPKKSTVVMSKRRVPLIQEIE